MKNMNILGELLMRIKMNKNKSPGINAYASAYVREQQRRRKEAEQGGTVHPPFVTQIYTKATEPSVYTQLVDAGFLGPQQMINYIKEINLGNFSVLVEGAFATRYINECTEKMPTRPQG